MSTCRGYSLVELLLALLVFSLGAMAVAAMQLGAVQASRSAAESASALMLAEDLLQRLLANADAIGRYEQILDGDEAIVPGASISCLDGSPCQPDAWAIRSVAAWLELSEQRGLAAARACVSGQATMLRVIVSWTAGADAATAQDSGCGSAGATDARRFVTLRVPLEAAS